VIYQRMKKKNGGPFIKEPPVKTPLDSPDLIGPVLSPKSRQLKRHLPPGAD